MNWYIKRHHSMKLSKATGHFECVPRKDCLFEYKEDRQFENEINEIKQCNL